MLGSNSLSKSQKRNRNSSSKTQISKTRKNKRIKANLYNIYDIEQTVPKTRKKNIKNAKSNETINNIDIIEDIDKVPSSRIDNSNETSSESSNKIILPPLSPISISSENPDTVIEGSETVTSSKKDIITILIDEKDEISIPVITNENDNEKNNKTNHDDNDDDVVEIIKEKIVKYSQEPTVFQSFSKNKVLWCHYCGTTNTSSWRHGPWGKKSLCNKHGCDYKGYGFTVRQPRLDLSKFLKEASKRIRPVIQEYCCVCFTNDSNKENVLVMCNGCYRAYHQNCYPDKISSNIVKSSKPFYCKEECKKTRELKKIETELPRKNLPFMFNRGLTNKNQKSSKSINNTQKIKESEGKESITIPTISTAPTSSALSSKTSYAIGSSSITVPSSPSKIVVSDIVEPEPKILKFDLLSNIIRERHIRRRGAKEEDKIVHYTKNLPPIIGFKHDNIPTPGWVYHETEIISPLIKRKNKVENKEELEDISDEAYIKRHHPLELSEKFSRCGALIDTSNIDEEAINKMIEKQKKKRKLKKGYIYI
ncbi:hypothetical protein BCR36DRAFT_344903 [Piromyces finnis]|uniref:PHD-type domain-containing protein n=1 Tax=Piromyces finnis TaxID=1754191 RepID=A0A1Y1VI56_9FUNG|nr:hypothetical protein BCR36DRAFT_344903 [Piromyces finnis]|eukprot:ORX57087.1 hypothetical protein BCR36DRAFT_344903 [Piromyces finnis]